jgi:ABC-type sulfate transport system permease subunit
VAPAWLERLGRAYGYGILVPVSLACYSIAWLFQRPGRLALAALFVTATFVARTGGPL